MIGALIGDVFGSPFEQGAFKLPWFSNMELDLFLEIYASEDSGFLTSSARFTDDTLLNLILFDCYQTGLFAPDQALRHMHQICQQYPNVGYGGRFKAWLQSPTPYAYDSCGNGAIMRSCFLPFLPEPLERQQALGESYTKTTHDHPDSLDTVKAFLTLSRELASEPAKRQDLILQYLSTPLISVQALADEPQAPYFNSATFRQALICLYHGNSFFEVLKNVLYVGGDTDTVACVACHLAELVFPVPPELRAFAEERLRVDEWAWARYYEFLRIRKTFPN